MRAAEPRETGRGYCEEAQDVLLFNLLPKQPSGRFELVFFNRSVVSHSLFRIAVVSAVITASMLWVNAPKKAVAKTASEPNIRLASPARLPNAMSVPFVDEASTTREVLRTYPKYLNFVVQEGKKSNARVANSLQKTYIKLKQRDPVRAARFLRGLRVEIVHSLSLMGVPANRASTRDPRVRKLVKNYLYEWYREADEYWLRSIAEAPRYR